MARLWRGLSLPCPRDYYAGTLWKNAIQMPKNDRVSYKHAVRAHDVEVLRSPHRAEPLEVVPRLQEELRLIQAIYTIQ